MTISLCVSGGILFYHTRGWLGESVYYCKTNNIFFLCKTNMLQSHWKNFIFIVCADIGTFFQYIRKRQMVVRKTQNIQWDIYFMHTNTTSCVVLLHGRPNIIQFKIFFFLFFTKLFSDQWFLWAWKHGKKSLFEHSWTQDIV